MKYKVGYIVIFFGWIDIKVDKEIWKSLGFVEKIDYPRNYPGNIYTDIFREEDT